MFQPIDAALLRSPTRHSFPDDIPWPAMEHDGTDPDRVAEWCVWLRRVWQVEGFADAVELASPSMARDAQRVCDGERPAPRRLRSLILSIMRYRIRATTRSTPFGLFAGVAPVRLDSSTRVQLTGHDRGTARVDAEWLETVISRLERCPDVAPGLVVVVNDLAFVRDGRLVLTHPRTAPTPGGTRAGGPAAEVSVRLTRPVRVALTLARSPIALRDVTAAVAAEFPNTTAEVIDTLLAELVGHQLLVTVLHPPMTTADALGHIVERAELAGAAAGAQVTDLIGDLRRIHDRLHDHDEQPMTVSAATRRGVVAGMTALAAVERPFGVDMRLGGALVLGREVIEEAAAAAGVLARLTTAPGGQPAWRDYHRRVLDRYGVGALVPVRELTDPDIGLGYPAGFRGSLLPMPPPPLTERDIALLALAGRAALNTAAEVVLDDDAVETLRTAGTQPDSTPGWGSPHTELTCQLLATSIAALDAGEFRLMITGVSRTAGTTTGRFLDLLDPDDRERMIAAYAALTPSRRDAWRAQVACAPLVVRAANVARTAAVLSCQITPGTHSPPGALALADLAVTADADALHLVSRSLRRAVEPTAFDAVEPARAAHPMQRFLAEISTAHAAQCLPFAWGVARHLPYLPRLRYGRVVLSPARWRLAAIDLPANPAGAAWDEGFDSWREQRHVPARVHLGDHDRRLHLDLTEPADRHLLRAELDRHPEALLREATNLDAFGWLDGRAHELVLPLASTHPPRPAVRPAMWGVVTRSDAGELPGTGRWLSAVIVAHPDRHQAILTAHLPALLAMWPAPPRFWFLRHHDPEHHIRLRIDVPNPAASTLAAQRVAAWVGNLRRDGLAGSLRFETYHPETGRFGAGATLAAAETVFATDSAVVLAQAVTGPDPALAAAGAIDLVCAFLGHGAAGLRWCLTHFPRTARPTPSSVSTASPTAPAPTTGPVGDPRTVRRRAIRLTDPDNLHAVRTTHPDGEKVIRAWNARRTALNAYRDALHHAGHPDPCAVLPDLLHLHHARTHGVPTRGTDDSERAWLTLARAAALSWTARQSEIPT